MKILYAAGNYENSKIVLSRFIEHLDNKHTLKIAAYKKSSPNNINIDWTLDCLLNMFRLEHYSVENNDNLNTYHQQIKYYNPDLIIGDMEYFTSHIANRLNIKLWQCSSLLINHAMQDNEKYGLNLFNQYCYIGNRLPLNTQKITNIIDNSDRNFVYSHLGDFDYPPKLKSNFEFIRPYHKIGKVSIPCKHNIVARLPVPNKNIINVLKQYKDTVIFTDVPEEQYDGVIVKKYNTEEYYCNLKNSNIFLCQGRGSLLADAYYNGKYSVVIPNFDDLECLTSAAVSEKMKLSSTIFDNSLDLSELMDIPVFGSYDKNIKYLHEKINEL